MENPFSLLYAQELKIAREALQWYRFEIPHKYKGHGQEEAFDTLADLIALAQTAEPKSDDT